MSVRVAVLGGSAVATPQLGAAMADDAVLAASDIELVLIGRSVQKLERVVSATRRVAKALGKVEGQTNLELGLQGVDYIVNQVRPGGLKARAFDERFPHELDLPGEETMGPGGFANAWRTLPTVQELFATCARVAPSARLLNLTNPAGMVHQVAVRSGIETVTFCDSPGALAAGAAAGAGDRTTATRPTYVGTNHAGWLTGLRASDGRDLLPAALGNDDFVRQLGFDPSFVRLIGALPNAYLRYVYHPDRQLAAQRAAGQVRAEQLAELERETLDIYARDGDPLSLAGKRRAVWYTACLVPALSAFVGGTELTAIAGISNGELVPWLAPETMLEVPVRLGPGGATPVGDLDRLADDVRSLLVANAAYEGLAVEALLGGDRDARVRALAANPMVSSLDVAARAVSAIESREGPGAL